MATLEEEVRFWTTDPGAIRLAQLCDQLKLRIDNCCGENPNDVAAPPAPSTGASEATTPPPSATAGASGAAHQHAPAASGGRKAKGKS